MTLRMFLNHSKSYLESRYLQNKAVEVELVNGQNERRSWIWAHGYDIIDIETKESYCTMSVGCERVFSSAKNLITDGRNGLKEDIKEIKEAYTLFRHWFRDAEA